MTPTNGGAGLADLSAAVSRQWCGVLDALWETVPAEMRSTRLSPKDLSAKYSGAFTWSASHGFTIDLSALPVTIQRELSWCMFRTIERGGKIPLSNMATFARWLGNVVADLGAGAPASLTGLPMQDWEQQFALAVQRRNGRLPAVSTRKTFHQYLFSSYRLLTGAYDPRPWWRREVWDPTIEPRIPLRPHEPVGRHAAHFERIGALWLRGGLQWHCKLGLETSSLTWTTVLQRVNGLVVFDDFLHQRHVTAAPLSDSPQQVRALMLDFLGHVRQLRVNTPRPTQGQLLSSSRVRSVLGHVEQFYAFMHENQDAAATALGDPEWLRLGPEHAVFFRAHGRPKIKSGKARGLDIIEDEALTRIMAGIGVLGAAVDEGGLGDEQAMRILMLIALTGRRMNEICMLDRDPLLALNTPKPSGDRDDRPFIARLRYQQTKIDGSPDTILVDAEVVALIQAQQDWANRYFTERGALGRTPRYLFLASRMNRNGDRPYSAGRLREVLSELVTRLDIRDSSGRLVDFQRTHRFRHTKGTTLLNAGVPLHVVQRYLGHVSPTMTMHYAQTLAATHEAEFLRYRKLSADARELDIDPRDLYDMLELDKRTDRILPNGWCLLPPRQICTKGNACLSCDKFATDATFLPELKTQLARTDQLIDQRRQAFEARTGQPMGEDNIWLAGRRHEQNALGRVIVKLDATRLADGTTQAVRGAGVSARTDTITGEQTDDRP
jgi:integrase